MLISMNGADATRQLALRCPLTLLGRGEANDIMLSHQGVSELHAAFVTRAGHVTIQDLGSRNGIEVNGERIQSRELQCGDTIDLGGAMFCFRAGGNAAPRHFMQQIV